MLFAIGTIDGEKFGGYYDATVLIDGVSCKRKDREEKKEKATVEGSDVGEKTDQAFKAVQMIDSS